MTPVTPPRRAVSTLQGSDPMVLMLNRGIYCPKDRQHLQALVPSHAQVRVDFSRLVTIAADDLMGIKDLRLGVGAGWPVLYDTERTVEYHLHKAFRKLDISTRKELRDALTEQFA